MMVFRDSWSTSCLSVALGEPSGAGPELPTGGGSRGALHPTRLHLSGADPRHPGLLPWVCVAGGLPTSQAPGGFATSATSQTRLRVCDVAGIIDSLRKKNAKNDMSAIGSRLQGCCRTSPWERGSEANLSLLYFGPSGTRGVLHPTRQARFRQ